MTDMPAEPGVPEEGDQIPLCVPHLTGDELQNLKACVDTNWVSSAGPFVTAFEEACKQVSGAEHAVATVNGTAALHLALRVAGIRAGDQVFMPSLTFIAPANAIRYLGAYPAFIDVDPRTGQLDPAALQKFIDDRCELRTGRLYDAQTDRPVTAILPVHLLGHPVDLDPVMNIANEYQLVVVEDASESVGAQYKGQSVGALGDVGCFSFNGNKLVTAGGGGMILTDREAWAEEAKYLSTQAKDDPCRYVHESVGYNYRLTNLQAAVGCAQLRHLESFIEKKRAIADRYSKALSGLTGVSLLEEETWATSVFWLSTLRLDRHELGGGISELQMRLHAQGIQSRPLWQPLHKSPAHADAGTYHCPIAEELHSRCLCLPSSVGLTSSDQDRVIGAVETFVQENT